MNPAETSLESRLRHPEPELADDGFSHGVMASLPRSRKRVTHGNRWVHAAGAAAGGILTAVLASPLDGAFPPGVAGLAPVAAVIFLAVIAAAVSWSFASSEV